MSLSLGIDLGTSGVRCAVVAADGSVQAMARVAHEPNNPEKIDANLWWISVQKCVKALDFPLKQIERLAIDGTSGTLVLTDASINPVTPAQMYNSAGFVKEAALIAKYAPASHITQGSNSALARLMNLVSRETAGLACHAMHQADFILAKFAGTALGSDHNNALKTGFDPETGTWPSWFGALGFDICILPQVTSIGQPVSQIAKRVAQDLGLSANLTLHLGTTDSVAAHIATRALKPGDAVSSIGTTLALKIVSEKRIDKPEIGLYSHKIGQFWLAGGASNTGGGVLLDHFSTEEIQSLTPKLSPQTPTGLDYYPLSKPGERFPINDPDLAPRLKPRPVEDEKFLQGLMEGIAAIEARGYKELVRLGAPKPGKILAVGGTAKNEAWNAIRRRANGIDVVRAPAEEACVGAAWLALSEPLGA